MTGRVADIIPVYVALRAMGRIDEATAAAVTRAIARAVARGQYGLRRVPTRRVGWRSEAPADEILPPDLVRWHQRVLEAREFDRFDQRDLRMVRDWVLSTKDGDPRLYKKIPRMSWPAIRVHAERRHTRIVKAADRTIGKLAAPGHVVLRLADGWTWQLLDTPELLDAEGASMGHCVGDGHYDAGCLIFSLRDPAGVPHVTVEFYLDFGRLFTGHVSGPRNAWLGSEFNAEILRLRREIGAWESGRSIP